MVLPDGLFGAIAGAGIVGLVASLRARQAPGFGWSLLSAFFVVIAGGVLLFGTLVWAFGLLVGIDMFFGGASLIAIALKARKAASHESL